MVRRFWCDAVLCPRRVFAERFGDNILAPLSRRTGRLETIVHHLGLALGGRPAAAFAERLMMPVSNDTLLRVVRRRTEQPRNELAIIGIDDFAFRRGQRYGTIVCDLERRRPVTLLPDRDQPTSQAWLANHPSIVTVARDRGGGYGAAIAKALPHADQVADRWHLMENASRAFLDAVGKSMRQIRKSVGSAIIDPKLLTYAERLQYEGYLRRHETNEAILELSKQGVPIKQIVKRTGHSRKLVRNVLRGQRSDAFRVRQSSLENWLPWLDGRWEQGARNASALWREMREKGFRGQIGVVSEWARRRSLAEKADQSALARTPSARCIARLMTLARDDLSKSDAVLIAAIESNVPDLVIARILIADFQQMIRSKAAAKLDGWLEGAQGKPRRVLCERRRKGHRRSPQCHHIPMVKRPDRGPDHQAQTHQAANVRPRERSTCSKHVSSAQLSCAFIGNFHPNVMCMERPDCAAPALDQRGCPDHRNEGDNPRKL